MIVKIGNVERIVDDAAGKRMIEKGSGIEVKPKRKKSGGKNDGSGEAEETDGGE